MADPLVSIIIPFYNSKRTIVRCLESIKNQTLQNYEVILIDDGSTDNTVDFLKKRYLIHKKIELLSQPNSGAGVARNMGIQQANGKYIAFMDSDDWYPKKDVLALLYCKSIQHNALICGGSFSSYLWGLVKKNYRGSYSKYTFKREGFIKYKDYQYDFGFQRFFYNRNFLVTNKLEFPPLKKFEDPTFFISAMIRASSFYALPEITYRYRSKPLKVAYSESEAIDLIKGIQSELLLSKENNLSLLHKLALERLNKTFYKALKKFIKISNFKIITSLLQANELIDQNLLGSRKSKKKNIKLLEDVESDDDLVKSKY